jgi:AhpD family alkylhydroperoxidase
MFRIAAQSPVGLETMLSMFGTLAGGTLGAQLQEQLAIAVSQFNECDWCLSAHTAIGRKHGLSQAELDAARSAESSDPKASAALKLAHRVLSDRGHIDDADIAAARAAGFTDGQVVEVVANVALTVFTNYLNNVSKTHNDFGSLKPRAAALAI